MLTSLDKCYGTNAPCNLSFIQKKTKTVSRVVSEKVNIKVVDSFFVTIFFPPPPLKKEVLLQKIMYWETSELWGDEHIITVQHAEKHP